jgi:hypothetical protein
MRLQVAHTCTLTSTRSTIGWARSISMADRMASHTRGASWPQRGQLTLGNDQYTELELGDEGEERAEGRRQLEFALRELKR